MKQFLLSAACAAAVNLLPSAAWAADAADDAQSAAGAAKPEQVDKADKAARADRNAKADKSLFKQEELEQMLAPIALYPDALLMQTLAASTYPLEISQAARWQKQNDKLTGEKLTAELKKQSWDPSVKAMVQIPSVLQMLSDKLEWTQKLGDAFLAQQPQVMATIQSLRKKALDAGNLKDSEQQKIISENAANTQVIRIEQTRADTVYVPVYNTAWVYGAWGYPGYPPYTYYPWGYYPYYPYSGFYYGAGYGLAAGMVVAANWPRAELYTNQNYQRLAANSSAKGQAGTATPQTQSQNGQRTWQHNPEHRQSVPYADRATQSKYDRAAPTASTRQQDYRGYDAGNPAGGAMNTVSPQAREQMQDRAASMTPEQRAAAQERIGSAAPEAPGNLQDRAASMSPAERAAAQDRLGSSAAAANLQQRANPGMPPMSDPYASRQSRDTRPAMDNYRSQGPSGGAFDGMGSGASARMDSARGAGSRMSAGAGAGAGARMGGGMRGGRR
jgi:hypothetical protein